MSCRKVVALLFACPCWWPGLRAPARGEPDRPSRVVIIVLDQARPDTITRYGMTNVQALQRKGTSFPNAMVGHMAAETVISHNVITSGLFPKHMGWSNEVYRDSNVLAAPGFPGGGAPGDYYVTSSMSCAQFKALIANGNYNKLQDYLDSKFGENSSFASISQKRTSACTSGHTRSTDPEDIIFQIRGSSAPVSCDGRPSWRQPETGNGALPAYFANTPDCSNRWWTYQQAGAYGTGSISPANIYPLDGDRFVPGIPPPGFPATHVGGDNWSADAAIRYITNRAELARHDGQPRRDRQARATCGGPRTRGRPRAAGSAGTAAEREMRHLPFIAKNADVQVGRIVDALEAKGVLDETLIVITADHAAQTGRHFIGVLAGCHEPALQQHPVPASPDRPAVHRDPVGLQLVPRQGRGRDLLDPSPAVAALRDRLGGQPRVLVPGHAGGRLAERQVARQEAGGCRAVLDMPDVMASYHINAAQDDYRLYGHQSHQRPGAQLLRAARRGARGHDGRPVGARRGRAGAHERHLRRDGRPRRHTKLVQNIPMVFYGPGVGAKDSNKEMRLVD